MKSLQNCGAYEQKSTEIFQKADINLFWVVCTVQNICLKLVFKCQFAQL
jgi:hypothetical protein